MTKTRSTKSALISGVLALLLCFTMLLGTTFAWFTDSVTSANNIIKSGTLDVEMYYADGSKAVPTDDSSDWLNAQGVAIYTAAQLWEPGYTDAKHIKISNKGNLALKYQLAIIPTGEVSELAEVIDVYLYEIADTWSCKRVLPNGDNTPGFTFNGNGHTISNLTIVGGGLFELTTNGTYATESTTFTDITFDNVTVTGGDYHVGVVWGQVAGDLVLNNVHVKNSNIIGAYNVSGLVGSTGEFAIDASVKYVDCSVTNTTLTANGAAGGDPTGASAFIGRALGDTSLVFEGNNVADNITYVNENGLVGGGIYGYTVWGNGGFVGTGVCDTFTNWDGLTAASDADDLKTINGGTVALTGTVDLGGTQGNYMTLTEDTTIKGGSIKGTGWTGELNYGVNATDGNIVFDGVTFDTNDWSTDGWAGWGISVNVNGTANVTFKNCTFKGTQCPIYQSGADSVITLENCRFDTTTTAIQCEIYSGDFQLGQDLIIKNCDFTGVSDVLHIYDYDKDPSTEAIAEYLTANANTFTGTCKQTNN